jgi:hypothetical protein
MNLKLNSHLRNLALSVTTAALLLGGALATAQEPAADSTIANWLGREFTVISANSTNHMPIGGKLTFVYDSSDNVVRICTRSVASQRGEWRMDFAVPCSVTLTFTRGTRFCTVEDVKAGNAEVLSACHRLRSRDVAMHPSLVKGAVELNDMIAFPVNGDDGKLAIAILVDSPARVTDGDVIVIRK